MDQLTRAERNIAWIEKHLKIPDGPNVGKPIVLQQFLKDDLIAIFDNPHNTRRAIISRGRKNGKSLQVAMILLLFICGPEAQRNAQMYSAARSRDQAALIFKLAIKMIYMSETLSEHVRVKETVKEITCPALGTMYKALSSEASSSYGLNPLLVIHDELGQVKGPHDQLYSALETAQQTQDNPLSIIISTQAPTDNDLLSILIDDAIKSGDKRTVLRFNTCTEKDIFSIEGIKQANPAWDAFQNKEEIKHLRDQAARLPSMQAEYQNLVLNQRVNASNVLIPVDLWKKNDKPVDLDAFATGDIYLGIDLSARNDLTAIVAVTKTSEGTHVLPFFFTPSEGLKERAERDRAPYDLWVKQGFIMATPGPTIDYDYVAQWLVEFISTHNVKKAGFDRWRIDVLKAALSRLNFHEDILQGVGQGFKDMTPAIESLESTAYALKLHHDNHPVMNMCIENCSVETDAAGNRKPAKNKSTGRIDGMSAMLDALAIMDRDNTNTSPFMVFTM